MNIDYNILTKLQEVLANIFTIEDKIKEIPLDLNDRMAVLEKTKLDYIKKNEEFEQAKKELEIINQKYIAAGEERVKQEMAMAETVLVRESENKNKVIEEAKNTEQTLFKSKEAKQRHIEDLEGKLAIQADIVKEQEKEVAEEKQKMDSMVNEQKKLLDKYIKERDELSVNFQSNFLFKFERIIRNKNGLGVVPLHGIICQGCYMKLPQQFANIVRRNSEINFCPYCSRVLFYEQSEEDVSNVRIYGDIHAEESEEFDEEQVVSADIFEGENLLDD